MNTQKPLKSHKIITASVYFIELNPHLYAGYRDFVFVFKNPKHNSTINKSFSMKLILRFSKKPMMLRIYGIGLFIFLGVLSFTKYQVKPPLPVADKDNGGLYLPGGFQAVVVIDSIGGGPRRAPAGGGGGRPGGQGARPAGAAGAAGQRPGGQGQRPATTATGAPRPLQVQSNQGRPANPQPSNYFGARHIAVASNGDIYVKLRVNTPDGESNAALRDTNGDGKVDVVNYWGKYQSGQYGDDMRIHNGYLYYSSELFVFRSKMIPGTLLPEAKVDTIVIDDMGSHEHITKPVAFDGKGHMFVGWGAGSNACQEFNRAQGSVGMGKVDDTGPNGCPLLKDHGGIWMFDENKLNQTQKDGVKYATGLRSIVGMDWDTASNSLYAVVHGRDDLAVIWPQYFDLWQSAMLPAEEFFKIPKGFNGGWPYYYYDQMKGKKMLNPEYGGDGKKEGNGAKLVKPLVGFPGHFAPNDVVFYHGNQFPARYKNGAFIAMHGATNRPPYPEGGYIVAFVPFKNGMPSGPWEVFADGFGGVDPIPTAPDAKYRPMGISEGPDGSLYLSETQKGKIWRVMFRGNKATFGTVQLAGMAKRKLTASNIRTPDRVKDNLDLKNPTVASPVFTTYCRTCHQNNGLGDGSRFPPLVESEWVNGDKTKLINIVMNGLTGPITVKGTSYNEAMPAHGTFLSDKQIADVLTYIRANFNNTSDAVSESEVAAVRKATAKK